MRGHRGFSLIELLIVVAVILIMAAIAFPNLMNSKARANEASAVGSMRAIVHGQSTYALTYTNVGYADSLGKLADPPVGQPVSSDHAGIIDASIGCASQPCLKSGYKFSILNTAGDPINTYAAQGVPVSAGQTGRRGFCADQTSQIMVDSSGGTSCTLPLD